MPGGASGSHQAVGLLVLAWEFELMGKRREDWDIRRSSMQIVSTPVGVESLDVIRKKIIWMATEMDGREERKGKGL